MTPIAVLAQLTVFFQSPIALTLILNQYLQLLSSIFSFEKFHLRLIL